MNQWQTMMGVQDWLTRVLYILITLLGPLAVILTNAIWDYGGILLTIAMMVWIGFSLVLLSPLLE